MASPCEIVIRSGGEGFVPAIIASAQPFLEQDVEANEEVTASHFLELKFRFSSASIAPGDGNTYP